jgi:DNA repair exonuclease SbcCD ATPase subunit
MVKLNIYIIKGKPIFIQYKEVVNLAEQKLWQAKLDEEQYGEVESLFEQALAEGKVDNKKDFQLKLVQLWKLSRLKEGKGLPKIDPLIVGKYSGDISRLESLTSQMDKLFIGLLEHFTSEQTTSTKEYEKKIADLMIEIEKIKQELERANEERKQALEEKKESDVAKDKAISEKEGMQQHLDDVERSIGLERKTHEQETASLKKDLDHEQERSRQKDQQIANLHGELQESKALIAENREISDKLREKENKIVTLQREHQYDLKDKLLLKETELRNEFNQVLNNERKDIRKEAKQEAWEVCNAKLENLKDTQKLEIKNLKKQYENEIKILKEDLENLKETHKAEISNLKSRYENEMKNLIDNPDK